MPVLSMFYGIIIRMFYMDNKQHKYPHIHAEYQDYIAVLDIEQDLKLEGSFPSGKLKILQAWIEIHRDELLADWKLAVEGKPLFKIEALK